MFTDWKAHVRKRARCIKAVQMETGNKGTPEKPLSDLEDRLLNATGKIVIDGIRGVKELGLPDKMENNIGRINVPSGSILQVEKSNKNLDTTTLVNKAPIEPAPVATTSRSTIPLCNTSSSGKIEKTKPQRPSLLSSLRQIANRSQSGEDDTNTLKSIDATLKKILDIKQKTYNLEVLKLKLKYDVDIKDDTSDDE